ncbi:hypothetical protein RB195_014461 [Necator americanus]|uniref:Uncharacterized protein n=1 Tax=Necator americanus TaxID=51031 RepID=A0ABR1E0B3_NECAM
MISAQRTRAALTPPARPIETATPRKTKSEEYVSTKLEMLDDNICANECISLAGVSLVALAHSSRDSSSLGEMKGNGDR